MDIFLFASSSVLMMRYQQQQSLNNKLTFQLLSQQNAETSNAIITHYSKHEKFQKLAAYEGKLTADRDQEDDEKIQQGIDFARSKNVLDPNFTPEPYVTIDVLGKSPDQVANLILKHVEKDQYRTGVIVLVGRSGTGKGTTVAALRHKLEDQKEVVTWSNGNIFRAVTLLAVTFCEQNDAPFSPDILTKENLAAFMKMLSFGPIGKDGSYDTRIQGLGLDYYIADIQNTILKAPNVSTNIPTVAQYTQGEVIVFASQAVEMLSNSGMVVLLEGREETVNYVRTPHRFVLVLSDASLIGKRRAAQRLAAAAVETHNKQNNGDVLTALDAALDDMVKEIPSY